MKSYGNWHFADLLDGCTQVIAWADILNIVIPIFSTSKIVYQYKPFGVVLTGVSPICSTIVLRLLRVTGPC